MAASNDQTAFEITRQFELPRARVWKAWSEPGQLQNWWGLKGCTIQIIRFMPLNHSPGVGIPPFEKGGQGGL